MAEQWKEWRAYLDIALHDKDRIWTKLFERIETRIGVDRVNIVLVLKIFVVIYLVVGGGREFVCNLIGFLYPAYTSIKAIESKEKDDDTKWLTYWVVYAAFSLVEFFSDYILSWLPFYWLLKCLFLIICMLPFKWNGSTFIYKRIIRPFFLKHQKTIDSAVDSAAEAGDSVIEGATGKRRRIFRGRESGEGDGDAKDAAAAEEIPASTAEEDARREGIFKRKKDEEEEEEKHVD
jgi:receptor expression-enhancing protein 5/6